MNKLRDVTNKLLISILWTECDNRTAAISLASKYNAAKPMIASKKEIQIAAKRYYWNNRLNYISLFDFLQHPIREIYMFES